MDLHRLPPQRAAERRRRVIEPRVWLVVLVAAATLWGLLDVRRRGFPHVENPEEHRTDFTVYTEAGAAFFDGRPPYEVTNPRGWAYLYPPMFALVLAPLHALAMEDQVTVWFFLSLLICWGCYRECARIVEIVCEQDPDLAARCARWFPWLAVVAVAAALLPTLNCLQRGQVGILKFYLLLLGVRLVLGGRTYRAWIGGGLVLAMPVVMKIIPLLPVGLFLFVQLVAVSAKMGLSPLTRARRRFAGSTLGAAAGVLLFVLLIPGALLGWSANLQHLGTWAEFMLTKFDDGGVDPRSGNSRSARNQSVQNAMYRLGNFAVYAAGAGPDDRLVECDTSPAMAMDTSVAHAITAAVRLALLLALLLAGARLGRQGDALSLALGFALGCVGMLVVSPVARGHYFMLPAPAILLLPLWLDQRGMPRAAGRMAVAPLLLCWLHYLLLPLVGRIGLLGLGTTCWLMAAVVLVARAGRRVSIPEPTMSPPSQPQFREAALAQRLATS